MANVIADLVKYSIITPQAVTVNLNDLSTYVIDADEAIGMAPLHRLSERYQLQHGETDLGFRLDPRRIRLKAKLRSGSPTELFTHRAELLSYFRPSASPLIFQVTLPDASVRYLDCFLEKGLTFNSADRSGLVQAADIVLVAPDPTFYAAATTLSLVFNDTNDVPYPGSWMGYPIITLNGPFVDPIIENGTTGERLEFTTTVNAGSGLVIDCRPGKKTVKTNAGVNQIQVMSTASDLYTFHLDHLQADTLNHIDVWATGDDYRSSVTIQFQNRYIGL